MYNWTSILKDNTKSSMSKTDKEIKKLYLYLKNTKDTGANKRKNTRLLIDKSKNLVSYDIFTIRISIHLNKLGYGSKIFDDVIFCNYLTKQAKNKTYAQFTFLYDAFLKKSN